VEEGRSTGCGAIIIVSQVEWKGVEWKGSERRTFGRKMNETCLEIGPWRVNTASELTKTRGERSLPRHKMDAAAAASRRRRVGT